MAPPLAWRGDIIWEQLCWAFGRSGSGMAFVVTPPVSHWVSLSMASAMLNLFGVGRMPPGPPDRSEFLPDTHRGEVWKGSHLGKVSLGPGPRWALTGKRACGRLHASGDWRRWRAVYLRCLTTPAARLYGWTKLKLREIKSLSKEWSQRSTRSHL